MSQDIHSSASSIDEYIEINEKGEIEKIIYSPIEENVDRAIESTIHCMINILDSVNDLFNLNEENTRQKFFDKLESLLLKKENNACKTNNPLPRC